MATLDDLRAAVAKDKEVSAQVIALLTDIRSKLAEATAASDPVVMQQIVDDLNANNAALVAAVTSV